MNKPTRIGEYMCASVYYDPDRTDTIGRVRGPIGPVEQVGIVFLNHETGKITMENGEPYVPKKYEYETKFYLVPTDDIDEAIELIKNEVDVRK